MEYRMMGGKDGLKISTLCLGTWQFGNKKGDYWEVEYTQDMASEIVGAAAKLGVTYFDTAEAYNAGRAEVQLGKALASVKQPHVISGKVLPTNCSTKGIEKSLNQTLDNLGVKSVDLYLVHWPIGSADPNLNAGAKVDPENVPSVKAAFEALQKFQKAGKIKHIGVSNFGVKQLTEALATGVKLISNQLAYNLITRGIEFEILPFCRKHNIGVACYSPLMQGLLTGRWKNAKEVPEYRARSRHFSKDHNAKSRHGEAGHEKLLFQTLQEIEKISKDSGISMVDLALSWPLQVEGISCVVVGATKVAQIKANAAAVQRKLSSGIVKRLDAATEKLKQAMGKNCDLWDGGKNGRIF